MKKMIQFEHLNDYGVAHVTLLASEIISIVDNIPAGGVREGDEKRKVRIHTKSAPDNLYFSTDPYEDLVSQWRVALAETSE